MTCPNGQQSLHHAIFRANFLPIKSGTKTGFYETSFNSTVKLFFIFILFLIPCRSTQIKTYSWDNAQVVLAGNKCDMEEERVVSVDSGRLLAEQLGKSWSNIHPFMLFELDGVFHFTFCYLLDFIRNIASQK